MRRTGMRHYDVQMIGGMVLHHGQDRRDADRRGQDPRRDAADLPQRARPARACTSSPSTTTSPSATPSGWAGSTASSASPPGVIVHGLDDFERQHNYNCDITYGQNNEFGFDYLRDNMKESPDRMVQRGLYYAVVDEVDSILIDEARTPLIISGSGRGSRADLYEKVDRMIPRLKREVDYTVDEKAHSAMLTDDGVERIEKLLGRREPVRRRSNIHARPPRQPGAARAHAVQAQRQLPGRQDNKVVIIDEHTGRKMPGRRWSRRPAPGDRGQGGRHRRGGEPDPRHGHVPELLPHLQEARPA